jgi:type II secretory pathway pseudopilin PulG
MLLSRKILLTGIAAAALATPALAADRSTDMQKQQYLNDQALKQQQGAGAAGNEGAIGATKPTSGPGVQGAPDTRTGPATHAPEGSASSNPSADSATTGASSGETGQANPDASNTTQPSQDSSGVQGFPDTRTGPATKAPSGGAQ